MNFFKACIYAPLRELKGAEIGLGYFLLPVVIPFTAYHMYVKKDW